MSILLTIETGPDSESAAHDSTRTTYLIRIGQSLVVGRDWHAADIVIEADTALSRAHFRVAVSADGGLLTDLGSSHGTLINGQRATETELNDGDQVAAGETRFSVEHIDDSVVQRVAPDDANQLEADPARTDQPPQSTVTLRILQTISAPAGQLQYRWLFVTLLAEESVILGRVAERSDICIPDDSGMSGRHLEVSQSKGQCRAVDLNSSNGSFLNGQRFSNELLHNGDEILCGSTYVLVQIRSDESENKPTAQQTIGNLAGSRGLRQQARLQSRGYQIVNATPFSFAPLVGRIGFPGHSLTMIVKATFQLVHDGVMELAEEQALPTGDVPFPGEDDPAVPQRYESDFAFYKPKADVLLAGHCHAPDGQQVQKLNVALQVGDLQQQLIAYGERFWQLKKREWKMTDPVPFSKLELRYKHAFGGEGFDENPHGVGCYDKNLKRADSPLPLPQLLAPSDVPTTPADQLEVVGFGPKGKWHGRRREQLGTYDKKWEETRWPWYPDDFQWDHFNAATTALQIDPYLQGDEEVVLTNLNPDHSELRCRLPGIRIRCFINRAGEAFREVPTKLDTMWIDVDTGQCVLVWRGNAQVVSEECEDVRQLFMLQERLDEPPLSLNDCHAKLVNELAARKLKFVPPLESPPQKSGEDLAQSSRESKAPDGAAPVQELANEVDQQFQQLRAEIRNAQIAAGVDPNQFDKQVEAETVRLAKEWNLDGGTIPPGFEYKAAMEFWNLQKSIHDAQVAAGVEANPLPPPPTPKPEVVPEVEETGWTRDKVEAHHASGGSLEGQMLAGLDLSGLDLTGANLRAAILRKAKLVGTTLHDANLGLANLAAADLTDADLTRANLKHADFSGAVLHKARLDNTDATGTIMAGVWLTSASMQNANAVRACFADADLTGAILNHSKFDNADFTSARLTRSSLISCSLVSARLQSVSARDAKFDHSDMTKIRASESDCVMATFHQASAPDSIWEMANLTACDFTWAKLQRANFTKAALKDARLTAADLAGARLTKSVMRRALLADANLFEANLQQVDLRYANLSRASFYGAEVSDALWEHSVQDAVNWKMTKRAQEQTS
ncbi:DUF2169 domain-containing protein [Fuerstiella marisgermanici]|uniref:Type III effector pipB n=1 Tax=Fuerstiella marisgermanici TaxID=1891926 RepID=A0A1P8WIG1_9PLAN|nr:DUF2169 domain-containing protein [Fuerstiella marisgermanici]APZ93855.1 Type III effector pipB [Fuerstiella marisgermanici]